MMKLEYYGFDIFKRRKLILTEAEQMLSGENKKRVFMILWELLNNNYNITRYTRIERFPIIDESLIWEGQKIKEANLKIIKKEYVSTIDLLYYHVVHNEAPPI